MTNTLYFGDNLHVLREYVKDESIDLIYLDPPFNSNANYNVLFKAPSGRHSHAQVQAFEDTWHWGEEAEAAYADVLTSRIEIAGILRALRSFLGENDMMAYLSMMAVRLIEMHRVLKQTGSLYLHCDPKVSHYLKIILDGIFGASEFRNEIVWKRSHAHNSAKRFGPNHDNLIFYGKSSNAIWNRVYQEYDPDYVEKHYRHIDADGRRYKCENPTGAGVRRGETGQAWRGIDPTAKNRHWAKLPSELERLDAAGGIHWPEKTGGWPYIKSYLNDMQGIPAQDVWTDIDVINMMAKERLGYPTQKPLSLLERVIKASSRPGDIILDPFCGCGTAIHAAQKLGRQWVGIDITHVAIQIIEDRLHCYFPMERFNVEGRPVDIDGARNLADRDKYQFQWWATSLIKAQPRGGHKKGPDRGVDGVLYFKKGSHEDGKAIVSVKGGKHIGRAMIGDLIGTRIRENADIAIFITLEAPTSEMIAMAASDSFLGEGAGRVPRCQILTIEQLLSGQGARLPAIYDTVTVRDEARREKAPRKPKQRDPRQQHLMLPLEGGKASKAPALQLDLTYDQPDGKHLMAAEEAAPTPTPPKRRRKAG